MQVFKIGKGTILSGTRIQYGITTATGRCFRHTICLPLLLVFLMVVEPAFALAPTIPTNFAPPANPGSITSFELPGDSTPTLIARRRRKKKRRKRRRRRRKPRYAYPYSFFLVKAPPFDQKPLPREKADEIKRAFHRGLAGEYPPNMLVKAGVAKYYPMTGGIFYRREPVKYLIMHSTETARPAGATRVIKSWSNRGRRHPGAQYVVERDGTIYMAVDPRLSTVHVNIFKTLKGINNDNSIGIEMVHSGKQKYTESQMDSVVKLVTYIREHFNIDGKNIITHKYAQQGHHTDPVNFAWKTFLARTNKLRNTALLAEAKEMAVSARLWKKDVVPGLERRPAVSTEVKTKSDTNNKSKTEIEPEKQSSPLQKNNDELNSSSSDSDKKPIDPKLRGPIEIGAEHVDKLKDVEKRTEINSFSNSK